MSEKMIWAFVSIYFAGVAFGAILDYCGWKLIKKWSERNKKNMRKAGTGGAIHNAEPATEPAPSVDVASLDIIEVQIGVKFIIRNAKNQ